MNWETLQGWGAPPEPSVRVNHLPGHRSSRGQKGHQLLPSVPAVLRREVCTSRDPSLKMPRKALALFPECC